MKILFAIKPNRPNSIIDNYLRGFYQLEANVDSSLNTFLTDEHSFYDVVHIQWPESLLNWEEPTQKSIELIKTRLIHWRSKGSKILVTRHNYLPHIEYPLNQDLYDVVYELAHGVIHFSAFSIQEFQRRYPQFTHCSHKVIPHPWYDDIPNQVSKEQARKKLGLGANDLVFLVFGNIRTEAEQQIVIQSFKSLQLPKKKLLFSNGTLTNTERKSIRKFPLLYLKRISQRFYNYYKHKVQHILIHDQFVPSKEVQFFLSACDVLVVQRFNQLNSGNIPLGFTFGKVVIGEKGGNIGEILGRTGNPVFDPSQKNELQEAMLQGIALAKKGQGQKNLQWAAEQWNGEKVAKAHMAFYQKLVEEKVNL